MLEYSEWYVRIVRLTADVSEDCNNIISTTSSSSGVVGSAVQCRPSSHLLINITFYDNRPATWEHTFTSDNKLHNFTRIYSTHCHCSVAVGDLYTIALDS